MSAEPTVSHAIGFWRTVRLLVAVARRRSMGRMERQQQLLSQRTGSSVNPLAGIAILAMWALMAALNAGAGYVLYETVVISQRLEQPPDGRVEVSSYIVERLQRVENATSEAKKKQAHDELERAIQVEAQRRAARTNQTTSEAEDYLRQSINTRKSSDFVATSERELGLTTLNLYSRVPAMLATLVLVWWSITLICHGEGLELDLQRRRHPMWEWLFSHPVRPGAVFFAEMLSPIASNPIYMTAPLFFLLLYGFAYSGTAGLVAMVVIGLPVAIAMGCVGKALEMGIILRLAPRSRGALIGFKSWLGYVAMILFLVIAATLDSIVPTVARIVRPVAAFVPWPWVSWAIGLRSDGSLSFVSGMIAWWLASAILMVGGIWFTVWGAQRGLAGGSETKSVPSSKRIFTLPFFRKDPLYRKEILWFLRDRSAIVQVILIPVTIAAFQLFNLRAFVSGMQNSWQYLSGAAIIFGTYFLWILGPRSLASEGPALWVAQSWPRGLEELMKAKARLWFVIATSLVAGILIFTLVRFPGEWWKVVLIGIGWLLFGRSMAAKSVTLVTVVSSSGEPEPVPRGRRWAASLGMLTFAVGILGQRWSLAIVGIVYSWLTAAAMWENFRARLPYLFDPWSETAPPPPTLLHAMVAISALLEVGSVITGGFMVLFARIGGMEMVPVVQAVAFGVVALIVWQATSNVLSSRGVKNKEIWRWQRAEGKNRESSRFQALLIGAGVGLVLGLIATGYLKLLSRVGPFTEMFRTVGEQGENAPNLMVGLFILAVFIAPFAEEYLFRGLLFRALDREWGGWLAVFGSAAFFAIYHPPASWLPVALAGVATALLFKRTGRLGSSVALHMVYNAVVIGLAWQSS